MMQMQQYPVIYCSMSFKIAFLMWHQTYCRPIALNRDLKRDLKTTKPI